MAILIANDGDKIVNTIAERDAIIKKFDGMEVIVKDAIADVMVGGGRAGYQWDTGAQVWKLVWKHNKDDLVFVTENLPISNGLVTLTNSPQSALVWDSFVTDAAGNMLVKLSNPQVTGKSVSIGSADYNGETLWVSYAYGKIQAAVQATAIAKVVSTDNALVRFNGTTGEVQNSLVVVDDVGNLNVTGAISATAGAKLATTSDNVLIGTTTDDGVNKLQVNGGVSVAGSVTASNYLLNVIAATYGKPNDTSIEMRTSGDTAPAMHFRAGSSNVRMSIANSGTVTVGGALLAASIKAEITPNNVAPTTNGNLTFNLLSNTQLQISAKGSDGVVRSTTLALA